MFVNCAALNAFGNGLLIPSDLKTHACVPRTKNRLVFLALLLKCLFILCLRLLLLNIIFVKKTELCSVKCCLEITMLYV